MGVKSVGAIIVFTVEYLINKISLEFSEKKLITVKSMVDCDHLETCTQLKDILPANLNLLLNC